MSSSHDVYRRHVNRQGENPYGHSNPSPFGERFTRRGEVMVTRHQLALLESLYDAPQNTLPSITEWVQVTTRRLARLHPYGVRRSAARVPEIWVSRTPYGASKLCALQARGRAIVEGTTPAWLIGEGRIGTGEGAGAPPAGEGRPGRGELLDRLDRLYWRLIEATDGEAPAVERAVVQDEVELSLLEAVRQQNSDGHLDRDLLQRCEAAAAAEDLQAFLQSAGALSGEARPEAVRMMYRFPHWWQRFMALEEVVLTGEIERYGVELATDRRREYREAGLRILESRLEVLT